ncbi:hypothetical protein FHR29_001885 [Sphingobacterium sp. JUb56]|nr:hypothetical protein [Sphingobacterium sp. JUb56]
MFSFIIYLWILNKDGHDIKITGCSTFLRVHPVQYWIKAGGGL